MSAYSAAVHVISVVVCICAGQNPNLHLRAHFSDMESFFTLPLTDSLSHDLLLQKSVMAKKNPTGHCVIGHPGQGNFRLISVIQLNRVGGNGRIPRDNYAVRPSVCHPSAKAKLK